MNFKEWWDKNYSSNEPMAMLHHPKFKRELAEKAWNHQQTIINKLKKSVLILAEELDYCRDHWKNNNIGEPCPENYPNRMSLINNIDESLDRIYDILGTDKILGYYDFDIN